MKFLGMEKVRDGKYLKNYELSYKKMCTKPLQAKGDYEVFRNGKSKGRKIS